MFVRASFAGQHSASFLSSQLHFHLPFNTPCLHSQHGPKAVCQRAGIDRVDDGNISIGGTGSNSRASHDAAAAAPQPAGLFGQLRARGAPKAILHRQL